MKKLAVFDYDSTLMDGETLEFLAKELNLEEQIKQITKKTMDGELDFFESLTYRVSLLKGLKEKKVNEICAELPFMTGAKETITELKAKGYKVVCFSGGFKNATTLAQKFLNLDGEFSNILHTKNGILTGKVGGEMMFNYSKGMVLHTLQSILNITPQDTVTIGDGANDLSMFQYAQTKIAFCAKEVLKKAATVIIEQKDLTKILEIL